MFARITAHRSALVAVLALVLTGMFASGCGSTGGAKSSAGGPPAAGLEGAPWQAVTIAAADGELKVPAGADVTMLLTDGRVTGRGGVNGYFGDYKATSDSLVFTGIGSTEMAGPPELMAIESAFFASLGQTKGYKLEGESLELLDDAGEVLVTMVPAEVVTLEGTDWIATGINNGKGGVQSPAADTTVTALFKDGTMAGNASINQYSAPYELDGDKLTIGMATTTMMAGSDEAMAQETAFISALSRVATWRINGDVLDLVAADGATQVTFVSAEKLLGTMGQGSGTVSPDTPTSSPAP